MADVIAVPDSILSVSATEIHKVSISVTYADGSIQSTTIEEGNDISVTYILNGTLTKAFTGKLTRILHTEPNMSFEVDGSTESASNKVAIPLVSIREIHNLSYPINDTIVPAPTV